MLAPTTHASARARPVRCLLAAALFGLAWLLTFAPAAAGQTPTVLVARRRHSWLTGSSSRAPGMRRPYKGRAQDPV